MWPNLVNWFNMKFYLQNHGFPLIKMSMVIRQTFFLHQSEKSLLWDFVPLPAPLTQDEYIFSFRCENLFRICVQTRQLAFIKWTKRGWGRWTMSCVFLFDFNKIQLISIKIIYIDGFHTVNWISTIVWMSNFGVLDELGYFSFQFGIST